MMPRCEFSPARGHHSSDHAHGADYDKLPWAV
jgi:hypothetical protein